MAAKRTGSTPYVLLADYKSHRSGEIVLIMGDVPDDLECRPASPADEAIYGRSMSTLTFKSKPKPKKEGEAQ